MPAPGRHRDGRGARGRRRPGCSASAALTPIAALAYGTRTVPRVDKIVGPGNRYVAAAKSLVTADCGIDFYAGPTEIVIVASGVPPAWIAADLIAQAEHDPDARAVLHHDQPALAAPSRPRSRCRCRRTVRRARRFAQHGGIIVTASPDEAVDLANALRPNTWSWTTIMARADACAGSIFVGPWSAQVAGDYAIGSNHVLPTAGAARYRGGLSAADFVRQVTVQRVSERGLRAIAKTVTALASAEGLEGHARSIEVRTGTLELES